MQNIYKVLSCTTGDVGLDAHPPCAHARTVTLQGVCADAVAKVLGDDWLHGMEVVVLMEQPPELAAAAKRAEWASFELLGGLEYIQLFGESF